MICVGLSRFGVDFGVDFLLMVEVVGHRRVGFGQPQVGVMPTHFFHGPAVGQMVHYNLCNANTRQPFQPGRFAGRFDDVRIGQFNRHGGNVAERLRGVNQA